MHKEISPDRPAATKHLLDFLTHWLAYHILGADQNMARQIKAIESGVDTQKAYEIEERDNSYATEPLLKALDGLFQQVSERNRELIKLNQSLEARVLERTRLLEKANQNLNVLARTDPLTSISNRRLGRSAVRV